jgi:hypothetical protein
MLEIDIYPKAEAMDLFIISVLVWMLLPNDVFKVLLSGGMERGARLVLMTYLHATASVMGRICQAGSARPS